LERAGRFEDGVLPTTVVESQPQLLARQPVRGVGRAKFETRPGSPVAAGAPLTDRTHRRHGDTGLWGCSWLLGRTGRVELLLMLAVVLMLAATVAVAIALARV